MSDNLSGPHPKTTQVSAQEVSEDALLEELFAADIQNVLGSINLPQYYVNSFTVTLGTGDVLIVMKRNGKPVGSFQVSYTVAKSFVEVLNDLISQLEKRTGNTIMTSKFIEQSMQEGHKDDTAT
jgi:hypothetical protein